MSLLKRYSHKIYLIGQAFCLIETREENNPIGEGFMSDYEKTTKLLFENYGLSSAVSEQWVETSLSVDRETLSRSIGIKCAGIKLVDI